MFEKIDKLLLAGLGAMSMTKEKAEELFDEYVKKGEAEKDQKSGFVKKMMDNAEKTKADLEKIVSEQVQKTVSKLNLATKDDIARLEEKIDKLQ